MGIIEWIDSLEIDQQEVINILGSLICLSNDRVYHRRAAQMLTVTAITEREAVVLKLIINEELLSYKQAMDET